MTRFSDMEAKEVSRIPVKRRGVEVGRPKRVVTSSMRSKIGSTSGFIGNTVGGTGGNFYSPELSTDFLEMPQSTDEKRNYYRWFYENDPMVGQALDLHTELPLSKIRLSHPKAKSRELAEKSLDFCRKWAERVGLLHRLIEIVFDYNLIGEVNVFCEDTSPDMPDDVTHEIIRRIDDTGEAIEESVERPDAKEREIKWLKKNYKGWTAIRVLPPEQVHSEGFPFTDEKIIELIIDSKSRALVEKARSGDKQAMRVVESMPIEIVNAIESGTNCPLNTDPEAGSFVCQLSRKKSGYQPKGTSILGRCLHTIVYRDKLRQSQTSIASRHMTPIRVIYAPDASDTDLDLLREQVDMALMDPDYSIITNFEITWEEMGSNQRLLELGSEYEVTDRQMYAGLGVTESLLSGESSYSGDRINLEVINTRYMLLREIIQDFVVGKILKPMCRRMGFIEYDEDGEEEVIVPLVSFTRLALRDNADTFDALFNLYQKGSVEVDIILELLNIDPTTTDEKLKRDVMTLKDSVFNEVLRSAYGDTGRALVEQTDIVSVIAKVLALKMKEAPKEGEDRF